LRYLTASPLLLLGAALVEAQAVRSADKPAPLVHAESLRGPDVLRTGAIEFLLRETIDGQERVRFGTWRFAGSDVILVDPGDEWGTVVRDSTTGRLSKIDYNTALHRLRRDGAIWEHHERSPAAAVFPGSIRMTDLRDPRTIGLNFFRTDDTFESQVATLGVGPIVWQVDESDGLTVVTGSVSLGSAKWFLDPARDGNPVRIELHPTDGESSRIEIQYRRWDDVWFPELIEERALRDAGGRAGMSMRILHAAFNRAEHPARLGPQHIGIEPRTNIEFRDREPVELRMWDGENAVTAEEYLARLRSGEALRGPTLEREMARLHVLNERRGDFEKFREQLERRGLLLEPIPRELSEWERYTLAFIRRHQCDEGQKERALAILRDCTDEGASYLSRNKSDFDAFDEKYDALRGELIVDQRRWEPLIAERLRLLEPLDRIFSERLKPRLDGLLTSEQRQRTATTQPTGRP
jgi:hypothetical protein